MRAVVGAVDVSLLDVVDEDDVEDVDDGGDVPGPSMSVVSGGLVLVIVWVVVEAAAESEPVAEYVGTTKSSGACSGSPNWRATAVAATISRPTTKIARMLAPTTVEVRLCQGCPSSSS